MIDIQIDRILAQKDMIDIQIDRILAQKQTKHLEVWNFSNVNRYISC